MTRALEATKGLVTPPPLDRWIDAVLLLCVSLVQGVATTLGMWRKIDQRDWHTQSDASVLPQAKPGIQLKENSGTPSLPLEVDAQRPGDSCCEYESTRALMVSSARSARRSNHEGVLTALSLSFRAKAQSAADPEPRNHRPRRRQAQFLASGSHATRASGTTPLVCQRT